MLDPQDAALVSVLAYKGLRPGEAFAVTWQHVLEVTKIRASACSLNARCQTLTLTFAGATMWQIGAEGGLFDKPMLVKTLVMAPAERADVLVDFGPVAGKRLVVTNSKPPKPVVTPAPSLAQVMQIRVASGTRVKPTIPCRLS